VRHNSDYSSQLFVLWEVLIYGSMFFLTLSDISKTTLVVSLKVAQLNTVTKLSQNFEVAAIARRALYFS
jgi:hypothetical protein